VKLTLLFDHRFFRDSDGTIFSSSNYNYELFASRYLKVFEHLDIVARVTNAPAPRARGGDHVEGPGVQIVDTGDWGSLRSLARRLPAIRRQIVPFLRSDRAVIGIVPGRLALIGIRGTALRRGGVYGVEMVGDPQESFGRGAIQHPLRAQLAQVWPGLLRPLVRGASAVAYVSEETLRRKYPPSPSAYTTHYSSIDLPDDKLASAPHAPPEGRRVELVFVGSLNGFHKGPDTLVSAVNECVEHGHDLGLSIIGSGHSEADLRALANPLGERVRFLGQLPAGDAVRSALDQADLFVLPTLSEGLPRSVIEAMARGLPVIASDVGGMAELLPPEDMVPGGGDASVLAAKITEVVSDPARLVQMAARNLERSHDYRASVLMHRRIGFYSLLKAYTAETSWSP